MLILTRRLTETLTIGDDITITVMAIKGSRVRIGIRAPGMTVRREEAELRLGLPEPAPSPAAPNLECPALVPAGGTPRAPRRTRESRP
jgi:carbon storage regulator